MVACLILNIKRSGTLPELPSALQTSSTSVGHIRPSIRAFSMSTLQSSGVEIDAMAPRASSVCTQNPHQWV